MVFGLRLQEAQAAMAVLELLVSNVTPLTGTACDSGGAGGGGVNAGTTTFAGGNILTSDFYPQIDGGIAGGGAGITGYDFLDQFGDMDLPMIASGGSGGGGNTSVGTGGAGGDGGIGCGGGGGGGTVGLVQSEALEVQVDQAR